jgi:proteic killer suppression protein
VIKSFGNKTAEDLYNGDNTKEARKLPKELWKKSVRQLDQLNAACELKDLRIPPGNRLEALKGELSDFYSVRINDQFRIIFKWQEGEVLEVSIGDYHK